MLLVGYTYQDYLKYQKYLAQKKLQKKNCTQVNEAGLQKLADVLLKFEKMYYSDTSLENDAEKLMLMEDSELYDLEVNDVNKSSAEVLTKSVKTYSTNILAKSKNKHDELFRNLINN